MSRQQTGILGAPHLGEIMNSQPRSLGTKLLLFALAALAVTNTWPAPADAGQTCPVRKQEQAWLRVTSGAPANTQNWSGMVALRKVSGDGAGRTIEYFCGGTQIARNWIVTAAHCVITRAGAPVFSKGAGATWRDQRGRIIEIIPAREDLTAKDTTAPLRPLEIIVHENYVGEDEPAQRVPTGTALANDIALLRVPDNAHATMPVAAKAPADPEANGNLVYVAGYGLTRPDGRALQASDPSGNIVFAGSHKLLEASPPVVTPERCPTIPKSTLNPWGNYFRSPSLQICAGQAKVQPSGLGADSCSGDSGGPLVRPDGNNCPVLVGLVSYGGRCGTTGVYTRMSAHMEWIRRKVPGIAMSEITDDAGLLPLAPIVAALDGIESAARQTGSQSVRLSVALSTRRVTRAPDSRVEDEITVLSPDLGGELILIDIDGKTGKLTYLLPRGRVPAPPLLTQGVSYTFGKPSDPYGIRLTGTGRLVAIVSRDKTLATRLQVEKQAQGLRGFDALVADTKPEGMDSLQTIASEIIDTAVEQRGKPVPPRYSIGILPYAYE